MSGILFPDFIQTSRANAGRPRQPSSCFHPVISLKRCIHYPSSTCRLFRL